MTYYRKDKRLPSELRPCTIQPHFLEHQAGSVLITLGHTKVICCATIEEKVPFFLRNSDQGWLTAEYSMLPSSTHTRTSREVGHLRHGRSVEIQRLIGRSLRMAFDMTQFREKTVIVDCDVIQADGGTRTASITGGFVAVCLALKQHLGSSVQPKKQVASISVGKVDDQILLDLSYEEDVRAQLDLNLVMDSDSKLIEIQGTGEKDSFSRSELNEVLDIGSQGIMKLLEIQQQVLRG